MYLSKGEKLILWVVGMGLVVLVILRLIAPRQTDWEFSFESGSTEPMGCKATYELLGGIFERVETNRKPMTQFLRENDSATLSLAIVTAKYDPSKFEVIRLLDWISQGHHCLVSALAFSPTLLDTLGLGMGESGFEQTGSLAVSCIAGRRHSVSLTFPVRLPRCYFTTDSLKGYEAVAYCDSNVVAIRLGIGAGFLILDSAPYMHTNYGVLYSDRRYCEALFSYLPGAHLVWDERNKPGRFTGGSLLSFVLSRPSLKAAYYTAMIGIVLSFFFGIRRRQRPIPEIVPLRNTSVELAKAIGLLWHSKGEHRRVALKKWLYFREKIHERTAIRWESDEATLNAIASKLGVPLAQIKGLDQKARAVELSKRISSDELKEFYLGMKRVVSSDQSLRGKVRPVG
jgi:hypothetical protein